MNTEMLGEQVLPVGFEELLPFVGFWAKATTAERMAVRCESNIESIKSFYDAMLDRAEEAMSLIKQFPLDDMPSSIENLSKLVLALCQASIAVEIHGQPRAPGTPYPNSIKLVKGLSPFG